MLSLSLVINSWSLLMLIAQVMLVWWNAKSLNAQIGSLGVIYNCLPPLRWHRQCNWVEMLNVLGVVVARTGCWATAETDHLKLQTSEVFFPPVSVWVWLPFSLIFLPLFLPHLPAIFHFLPVLDDCTSRLPAEKKKKEKNNRCGESFFYTTITVGTFSLLFFSVCCHLMFNFHIQSHAFLFFISLLPRSLFLSLSC